MIVSIISKTWFVWIRVYKLQEDLGGVWDGNNLVSEGTGDYDHPLLWISSHFSLLSRREQRSQDSELGPVTFGEHSPAGMWEARESE